MGRAIQSRAHARVVEVLGGPSALGSTHFIPEIDRPWLISLPTKKPVVSPKQQSFFLLLKSSRFDCFCCLACGIGQPVRSFQLDSNYSHSFDF